MGGRQQGTGGVLARAVVAVSLALGGLVVSASPGVAAPLEDYAKYQPQTRCSPRAKPGTKELADWLVARGGGRGAISRRCKIGGTSEHKEGRAFDWVLDATKKHDRKLARAFLRDAFAADGKGREDALARRMGIMYIIWNDHMWSAWDEFAEEDYLASSCSDVKHCSATLRHRDHLHVSLSRKGGRGDTSWYTHR